MENMTEMEYAEVVDVDQMSLADTVLTDVTNAIEVVGDAVDLVADPVIVMTHWGANWLGRAWKLWRNGGPAGLYATNILAKLDEIEGEPEEYVETHTKEEIKTIIVPRKDENGKFVSDEVVRQVRVKIVKKLKKGHRSSFAAAVAKQAYNKFGERTYSEANVLVTRRWLQKYFDDVKFTDLRTVDKNNAIDRALFLSFVPTRDFQQARIAMATKQWQARVAASGSFKGFWTTVFGVGIVEPGIDNLC